MTRVGLTGGIGSGKSTVAAMLASQGAVIIDADQIARDLVEPGGAALAELVTEFGPRILQADGSLSRAELASLAFSDPRATERLNAIMHPLIRAEAARRLAAQPDGARRRLRHAPAGRDRPGATSSTWSSSSTCPRRCRSTGPSGCGGSTRRTCAAAWRSRRRREERVAAADVVIDNCGDLEDTAGGRSTSSGRRLVDGRGCRTPSTTVPG